MRVVAMMTRRRRGFAAAFRIMLLVVVALFLCGKTATAECDSCRYDGSDGDTDCKVYGQLGDNVLIPYHRASQDCLDAHSIKVEAVDATMLSTMFPNADGSDANVNAIVSWLKNDSGAAVNGILTSLDFFFVESTVNGQKPVFQDSIIVQGETFDCTESESDCWNAMKTYFESEEGQEILTSVAEDLYAKAAVGRELEQSTVRIAICNNHDAMATSDDGSCDALATQIDALKTAHPDKACSAFGLGPAENDIPGCNANGGSDAQDDSSSTRDATSSAAGWFSISKSSLLLAVFGGSGLLVEYRWKCTHVF